MYIGCISLIGWERLRDAMTGVSIPWLVLMTLVTFAGLWIRVVKWRLVLGKGSNAIGVFFLSKAAGEWSPGRIGELSPLLIKRHRNARMAAWIVVDRILEMAVTVGIGVLGLAAVQAPNRGVMIVLAILIGIALLLALYLLTRERLFLAIAGRFPSGPLHRVTVAAARVSSATAAMRKELVLPLAITIGAGCLDVWAGMLLYQAFGWPVPFALMATAKGVHAVTSAIPITPNATGVPYLTTAVLIHEVGGVPSGVLAAGIALSVVVTNLIFWLSLAAGAADLRKKTA
ncbi:MAG: hypothetical protein AMXMBFR82_05140 [Candidatus Hydrogenedentota bacterium]